MSDGVTLKRIIDLDTQSSIGDGVYTIVDSETDKAKKYNLGGALSDLNDALNSLEDAVLPSGGTTGQLLRKKSGTDYDTEWTTEGTPTKEQVDSATSDWLDDHPEATTTVEDGSLTQAKFTDETWLNVVNDYVTPQMYGAKADGTTDDTQAFQDAVDATNFKKMLYIPGGVYKITQPITLSKSIVMRGVNNFKAFGNYNTYSTLQCTGTSLFTLASGNVNVNLDGIVFAGNGTNILFDCALANSVITRCTARDFHTIFNKYVGLGHIHDNSFLAIRGYFVKGQVTDSFFINNYINGDNTSNATCFIVDNFTATKISGNYIDYFKYGFYHQASGSKYFKHCIITDNIFDIIWRVFNCRMETISICNNMFTNISASWFVNDQTQTSKMNNADAEMLAHAPCGIYSCSSTGLTGNSAKLYIDDIATNGNDPLFTNVTICGNTFDIAHPLYLISPIVGLNIRDNAYAYDHLCAFIDNGGDATHLINSFEDANGSIIWVAMPTSGMYTNKGSFIDLIHRINVDNQPRMLNGTKIFAGLYQYRNVVKGFEVVHNSKVYRAVYDWPSDADGNSKNTVKWFDYMGNQEM